MKLTLFLLFASASLASAQMAYHGYVIAELKGCQEWFELDSQSQGARTSGIVTFVNTSGRDQHIYAIINGTQQDFYLDGHPNADATRYDSQRTFKVNSRYAAQFTDVKFKQ